MNDIDWQTEQFERHRRHLAAVAYRMLGSTSEAEDALQEAWLRLGRSRQEEIHKRRPARRRLQWRRHDVPPSDPTRSELS